MFRSSHLTGAIAVTVSLLALTPSGVSAKGPKAKAPFAGVSVKVSEELAPPGAIAQVKVFVTEPKPITTGRAAMRSDFSEISGIALGAPDAAAVAIVTGGNLAISIVSPSGAFGMDPDYPVLTVAGRVPSTVPLGTEMPVVLDPAALLFLDPAGAVYPVESKPGLLVASQTISIGDVVPGSDDLPAGGVVSVLGTGFEATTRIQLKETVLAQVQYVDSGRIDVVLAQPARMHGMGIRAKNRDGEATYFSYQRTTAAGLSTDLHLRDAVPVFQHTMTTRASVQLSGVTQGLALQNLGTSDTMALAELENAEGLPIGSAAIPVPANTYLVRSLTEIFGVTPDATSLVRLVSIDPIQVLGINVDAAGLATPQLAR
jgi:hypothetical protein